MNLHEAMALTPGDIVAFVGAGGKTHSMFRLADELVSESWRVVTTTTTRIAQDELRFAPQRVGIGSGMRLPDTLPDLLDRYRHVFVFTRLEPDGKVRGIRAEWLDQNLTRAANHDFLLIEADGSRRLPMKAPKPDEPVIPASTTVVAPVVGLDALGTPLNEAHVYGAEIIQAALGCPADAPVTPVIMASVLINPRLGLKNVPASARVIPILNKVTTENLPQARIVAQHLLTDLHVERVLITAVTETNPVREVHRRIGAVVLAAGQSTRMGQPKMLLPWKDGTIIRQVASLASESRAFETVVVAGALCEDIRQALEGVSAQVVPNPYYEHGDMLSSLQIGLRAIWHTCDAVMILLGDQPAIPPDVLERVMRAYEAGKGRIIAPSFNRRRGHPIIIDKSLWQSIMELPQGAAPRDVIRANEAEVYHLVVSTDAILRDIDTPEEYEQARRGSG